MNNNIIIVKYKSWQRAFLSFSTILVLAIFVFILLSMALTNILSFSFIILIIISTLSISPIILFNVANAYIIYQDNTLHYYKFNKYKLSIGYSEIKKIRKLFFLPFTPLFVIVTHQGTKVIFEKSMENSDYLINKMKLQHL